MKKIIKNQEPILSPNYYPLLIDEDRGKVLKIVFSLACGLESVLKHELNMVFVEKCFFDLLNEVVDKEHKLGWCKDPKCDWKSKEIKSSK